MLSLAAEPAAARLRKLFNRGTHMLKLAQLPRSTGTNAHGLHCAGMHDQDFC
jgi:hypothetical protein